MSCPVIKPPHGNTRWESNEDLKAAAMGLGGRERDIYTTEYDE